VRNSAGTIVFGPSVMAHVSAGLYSNTGWTPATAGQFSYQFDPVSASYSRESRQASVQSWTTLVQTALTAQGYTAARAPNLDNLDATVSSRTTQADILSDSTPFAGADVATILVDTAAMQPTVAANLDAAVSSRATQAQILSDATPFPGANLDAAISSRSSHSAADVDTLVTASHGVGAYNTATGFSVPGDAMDLVADAVDSASLATTAVNEVRDSILSDSTPFAGANVAAILADTSAIDTVTAANLDATVSSRSTLTAAQVDTELTGTHGAGLWTGSGTALTAQEVRDSMKLSPTVGAPAAGSIDEALDEIVTDTSAIEPLVSTNLDATVSSRSTLTAAQVDTELSGVHGAGNWEGDDAATIDAALSVSHGAGSWSTATGFSTPAEVAASQAAIQADIAALNNLSSADIQAAMTAQGYTTPRASLLDNLDAAISSIATQIASLNDLDASEVAAAVWSAAKTGHVISGSFGEALVASSGDAGLNTVLDGGPSLPDIPHADNNLTSARLRIFATANAATAATNGAPDGADGELLRLNFDLADYGDGSIATVPKILKNALRTSS